MSDQPKVLMLDIDGVLNNMDVVREGRAKNREASAADQPQHEFDYWGDMLSRDMIGLLNGVKRQTGCSVVVSSTWRLGLKLPMLELTLQSRGYEGIILDYTPNLCIPHKQRGDDIQSWIDTQTMFPRSLYSLTILDDNSDMKHLSHRLVKTDTYVGLTPEKAEELVAMIETPFNPYEGVDEAPREAP